MPAGWDVTKGTHSFVEYLDRRKIDVPYGVIRSTFDGVLDSVVKIDRPNVTVDQFGREKFGNAINFLTNVFSAWRGGFEPRHPFTVDFNYESSLGPLLKKFDPECKWKGDLCKKYAHELDEYWRSAHLDPEMVPLFHVSGKEEIRPADKVRSNTIRTIIFSDPFYTLCGSAFISNIVEFFKGMVHSREWPFRYGGTFADGGMEAMFGDSDDFIAVMGDCSKWDSGVKEVLFEAERLLFEHFLKPEYHEKFRWYFKYSQYVRIHLPTGQVILCQLQCSGDWKTTPGNCLGHLFIQAVFFLKYQNRIQFPLNIYDKWFAIRLNLYSDDHVNLFPPQWAKFLTYHKRKKVYESLGQTLHEPPMDQVQRGVEGLTFLGATIVRRYGSWVPQFQTKRLLAIFACHQYRESEMPGIIRSVAPMFLTNDEAWRLFYGWVKESYPLVLPYLNDVVRMDGAELVCALSQSVLSKVVGGDNIDELKWERKTESNQLM